jgi:transcription elongation factor GreA
MPKKEIFLTNEGFLKLETELDYLKSEKRPEIMKLLKEARALGDLSENSEYTTALDEQEKLEKRIKEIEYSLEHATIIEEEKSTDKVCIGSTVKIKYIDDEEVEEYKIVGSQEANPFENKISNESPIASAILGKKLDQVVDVESPSGIFQIQIVNIA